MKKQAINQFNKGLIMDVNPLMTPNDALTNALNATIITFNGDEYVLQNDMGNGRVHSAKLPSGYIPMGVTSFGGIIYIASYNPLTNKGQIGSFPSPQRNFENLDTESKEPLVLTSNDFITLENDIPTFSNLVVKKKLSDLVLSAGDKYIINYDDKKALTELETLIDNKIISAEVVIINSDTERELSLGSFKDTIKTKKKQPKNQEEPLSVDDYISVFEFTNYSVVTSKSSGELYIKFSVRYPEEWSLLWETKVSETNPDKVDLIFKQKVRENEEALSHLVLLQSEINGSQQIIPKSNNWGCYSLKEDKSDLNDESLFYTFNKEGKYTYTICAGNDYGIIPSLKVTNTIDLSKIGSNTIDFHTWKYYNQEESLILNFGFNSYLTDKISSIVLSAHTIENIMNDKKIPFMIHEIKNGNSGFFKVNLEYSKTSDDNKLKKNKCYLIEITIISGEDNNSKKYKFIKPIFTNELFNEQYLENTEQDFSLLELPLNIEVQNNTDLSSIIPKKEYNDKYEFYHLEEPKDQDIQEVKFVVDKEVPVKLTVGLQNAYNGLFKVQGSVDSWEIQNQSYVKLGSTFENESNYDVDESKYKKDTTIKYYKNGNNIKLLGESFMMIGATYKYDIIEYKNEIRPLLFTEEDFNNFGFMKLNTSIPILKDLVFFKNLLALMPYEEKGENTHIRHATYGYNLKTDELNNVYEKDELKIIHKGFGDLQKDGSTTPISDKDPILTSITRDHQEKSNSKSIINIQFFTTENAENAKSEGNIKKFRDTYSASGSLNVLDTWDGYNPQFPEDLAPILKNPSVYHNRYILNSLMWKSVDGKYYFINAFWPTVNVYNLEHNQKIPPSFSEIKRYIKLEDIGFIDFDDFDQETPSSEGYVPIPVYKYKHKNGKTYTVSLNDLNFVYNYPIKIYNQLFCAYLYDYTIEPPKYDYTMANILSNILSQTYAIFNTDKAYENVYIVENIIHESNHTELFNCTIIPKINNPINVKLSEQLIDAIKDKTEFLFRDSYVSTNNFNVIQKLNTKQINLVYTLHKVNPLLKKAKSLVDLSALYKIVDLDKDGNLKISFWNKALNPEKLLYKNKGIIQHYDKDLKFKQGNLSLVELNGNKYYKFNPSADYINLIPDFYKQFKFDTKEQEMVTLYTDTDDGFQLAFGNYKSNDDIPRLSSWSNKYGLIKTLMV